MNEDIDYLAQQMMQNGILPTDFYNSSMSDFIQAQKARTPEDRPVDPLALARGAGLA